MADPKIDSFDIGALERAVNDSAGRVSGIWLSFVAFSAYLAAAASMVSHRQMFLEEPIKLPTVNIDLPLVASAILLPLLFVIYHIFVLLQVVLLARTADAYNEAIEHGVPEATDRTRVRQRLANTLFAQLFAGSPREREGVLGWLLRLMAWVTLAIAPVCVLVVFELKFLPHHSALVTWTHRGLIVVDLLAILLLWAGAVDPRRDIAWQGLMKSWKITLGAAVIAAVCCLLFTFPGEPNRLWMRLLPAGHVTQSDITQCQVPWVFEEIFVVNFDRLSLPGEDFVDDDKLAKIISSADAKDRPPYDGERTRNFRMRDLSCGNFSGTDLRHVDLSGAHMSGAHFDGAKLQGARMTGAVLESASMEGARLDGSDLYDAHLLGAVLNSAQFHGARLDKGDFQNASLRRASFLGASLDGAQFPGAKLDNAKLAGVSMPGALLAGASLSSTELQGTNLKGANLVGAKVNGTQLQGADLSEARLQGADLYRVNLSGAKLTRSWLQGATIRSASLPAATFYEAQLQGVQFASQLQHVVIERSFIWLAQTQSCRDAWVILPRPDDAIAVTYAGTLELPQKATPDATAKFIEQTLELLPPGFDPNDRDTLRTTLQTRLTAGAEPSSKATQEKWQTCAEDTSQFWGEDDHDEQTAVHLGELACMEGRGSPYIARAIQADWIFTGFQLNESGRKLLAQALLGSKDSPCPGAAGLGDEVKQALRDLVDKKPAE
jgi:uncharacterized protein YjbI with pentapeptide repeats